MSDDHHHHDPIQSIGCAAFGLCVPLALFQIVLVVLFNQMGFPFHRLYTWPVALSGAGSMPDDGEAAAVGLAEIICCVVLAVLYGFVGTIAVGLILRGQGR